MTINYLLLFFVYGKGYILLENIVWGKCSLYYDFSSKVFFV